MRTSSVSDRVRLMQVLPIRTRALTPPQDSLLDAIRASKLKLKEGDIVAISSKVVSIDEGRTLPVAAIDKGELIRQEADWYLEIPNSKWRSRFTVSKGAMAGSAGIDESNGDAHYILYPRDPFTSAKRLRRALMKIYGVKKLGVVITDSISVPLRRGAIGFALAWDGIEPLRDYRGTKDIFGRSFKIEVANVIDALAAAAGLSMGEGNERTPIAIIRNAENVRVGNVRNRAKELIVSPEDDVFAPFFMHASFKWKRKRR